MERNHYTKGLKTASCQLVVMKLKGGNAAWWRYFFARAMELVPERGLKHFAKAQLYP